MPTGGETMFYFSSVRFLSCITWEIMIMFF